MSGALDGTPFGAAVTVTIADDEDTSWTAPTVSAIERQTPATSPTSADSLTWRVTFSEDVNNVDAADFAVDGTTATLAVSTVTASTVYDVAATGGDLAGLDATVTLSFATGQDIADTSDNALANTAPTGTDDATYVVDNTAPTVTITGVPATSDAAFTATFTFSETVTGFAAEDIEVGNGTAAAFAETTAGTVFTAQITPTANGEVTVDVAADAAEDAAGNGSTAAAQATSTYTAPAVDSTAPTASSATVDGAVLAITFDEALAAAPGLSNDAFEVKKTPQGGSEADVALSGVPAIVDTTVTLALAQAVVSTDAVTVLYTKPASGTDNRLEDASGNEVATFAQPLAVTNNTNSVPTAADSAVTTNEDTAYAFAASDFGFSDEDSGDALESVKVASLPASDTGSLSLDGTAIAAGDLPQAVTSSQLDNGALEYTPPADANGNAFASFTFKVNDGTADSASAYAMTVNVAAVNDAPTVANAVDDLRASVGVELEYQFPEDTFSDVDVGDTLAYEASRSDDTALPSWLAFTPATRTFVGTPAATDAGTLAVKVTASDAAGRDGGRHLRHQGGRDRRLRPHPRGARRHRRQGLRRQRLRRPDAHPPRRHHRDAGPGIREPHEPESGRLRRAHRADATAPARQRPDLAAGGRLRRAHRADAAVAARKRPDLAARGHLRRAHRVGFAGPARQRPGLAARRPPRRAHRVGGAGPVRQRRRAVPSGSRCRRRPDGGTRHDGHPLWRRDRRLG